jgi:L-lysine 6-oxidase
MTGDLIADQQAASGTPAGMQVLYARGINTFSQMITAWSYMGFIVNQSTDPWAGLIPYLAEQERNDEQFIAAAVAVGEASNVVSGADTNFANAWFMPQPPPSRAPVTFATSRHQGRASIRDHD